MTVTTKAALPPLEVILVRKRSNALTGWAAILPAVVGVVSRIASGGYVLMLLAPRLHDIVGSPRMTPSYWSCVVALVLLGAVYGSVTNAEYLMATKPGTR